MHISSRILTLVIVIYASSEIRMKKETREYKFKGSLEELG